MLPTKTDMHLIVLDDDESTALFMATVARKLGWTAQTVTDEAHFQALISAAPPDAIMLDLQLGASDGVEQLRFLRSVGYSGAIVLISGFDARVLASAQQIGESLGLTIAAVLEKPARAAQVREVLAAMQRSFAVTAPPPTEATTRACSDRGQRHRTSDKRRADGVASATDRLGRRTCRHQR